MLYILLKLVGHSFQLYSIRGNPQEALLTEAHPYRPSGVLPESTIHSVQCHRGER